MGHTIVGRLPKSQRWRLLVRMLQLPHLDAPNVAAQTVEAANRRLLQLRGDPSLTYCFWLLTRLAAAARGPDFQETVAQLGVPAQPGDTALQFVARVADRTRVELDQHPESGPFGDMAALALRRALSETVGTQGRSLLGSSLDDLEDAFRRHSSAAQFGELSQRFFGDFMARTLRFYIDRELPHAVGGGALPTIGASHDFTEALDLHTRQTARIVEGFAAAWYSKHNWETMGAIGRDDAEGFVAHALSKLRSELRREGTR